MSSQPLHNSASTGWLTTSICAPAANDASMPDPLRLQCISEAAVSQADITESLDFGAPALARVRARSRGIFSARGIPFARSRQ